MSTRYYFIRRLIYMLVTLWVVSVASFIIIQLPPGDYLATVKLRYEMSGTQISKAELESLKRQYGLDLPVYLQYFKWIGNMLRGDLGRSFAWNRPVIELLAERLPLTVMVSILTLVFTYIVAIPVGIYSAVRQYSIGDYTFTILGYAGLSVPNFLLAMILMFLFLKYFGISTSGLFSPQYMDAPWSTAKFVDMLRHLPIPLIVIGTAGTCGLIRIMRGCLLDELKKQYVVTARAKGLSEKSLLWKYPIRVAINPIVSTIGWTLPAIVSGQTITAIVLNLPTIGPQLFQALISQDTYLAGSTIMILSSLTIIGTFISDILLAFLDPRIKYEKEVIV